MFLHFATTSANVFFVDLFLQHAAAASTAAQLPAVGVHG